jgi:hypothetical protein
MKKMMFLILIVGLAFSGYLIQRHRERQRIIHVKVPAPAQGDQPMNDWQQRLTLDLRTDYTGGDPAQRQLIETLRQEEQRQKPQEGRN